MDGLKLALATANGNTSMLQPPRLIAFLCIFCALFSSCRPDADQIRALQDENARLKKALEEARGQVKTGLPSAPAQADLNLTLKELWSQRFEDNQFRAKQRLDQKQLRVTGLLESVSDHSVTLFATGTPFGSVSLLAQLEDNYIKQISDGLANLEKGAQVTLQGRFLFDKMTLDGAVFVDRGTGKPLDSRELTSIPSASVPTSYSVSQQPSTAQQSKKSAPVKSQ